MGRQSRWEDHDAQDRSWNRRGIDRDSARRFGGRRRCSTAGSRESARSATGTNTSSCTPRATRSPPSKRSSPPAEPSSTERRGRPHARRHRQRRFADQVSRRSRRHRRRAEPQHRHGAAEHAHRFAEERPSAEVALRARVTATRVGRGHGSDPLASLQLDRAMIAPPPMVRTGKPPARASRSPSSTPRRCRPSTSRRTSATT